jgi:hypothetical protein
MTCLSKRCISLSWSLIHEIGNYLWYLHDPPFWMRAVSSAEQEDVIEFGNLWETADINPVPVGVSPN